MKLQLLTVLFIFSLFTNAGEDIFEAALKESDFSKGIEAIKFISAEIDKGDSWFPYNDYIPATRKYLVTMINKDINKKLVIESLSKLEDDFFYNNRSTKAAQFVLDLFLELDDAQPELSALDDFLYIALTSNFVSGNDDAVRKVRKIIDQGKMDHNPALLDRIYRDELTSALYSSSNWEEDEYVSWLLKLRDKIGTLRFNDGKVITKEFLESVQFFPAAREEAYKRLRLEKNYEFLEKTARAFIRNIQTHIRWFYFEPNLFLESAKYFAEAYNSDDFYPRNSLFIALNEIAQAEIDKTHKMYFLLDFYRNLNRPAPELYFLDEALAEVFLTSVPGAEDLHRFGYELLERGFFDHNAPVLLRVLNKLDKHISSIDIYATPNPEASYNYDQLRIFKLKKRLASIDIYNLLKLKPEQIQIYFTNVDEKVSNIFNLAAKMLLAEHERESFLEASQINILRKFVELYESAIVSKQIDKSAKSKQIDKNTKSMQINKNAKSKHCLSWFVELIKRKF